MNTLPLVSIGVITYNSSEFVVETLESVYKQDYPNIELIVSDDCSSDDTLEKVQQWISEFGHKFTKVEVLTTGKNTGITANCSRTLQQTSGEWIKFIAGDDILYPHAISSVISFVRRKKKEDVALVVSSVRVFEGHPDNLLYIWPTFKISDDIHEQLKRELIGGYIKSPGVFMKRAAMLKLGGFNPRYPMLEDDPMWIKCLTNGYKFYFNNEVLVGYRIHPNATSNGSCIPKKHFFPSLYAFKKEIAFPLMKKERLYFNYIVQHIECKIYNRLVETGKINRLDKLQLKILHHLDIFFLSIGCISYNYVALKKTTNTTEDDMMMGQAIHL